MVMVLEAGTGRPVLAFVPIAQVRIERTWAASGLRGCGSAVGSRALQRGDRVNRVWRDLETGSRHTSFARALPARYLADLEARDGR
jgi:hypothetical protein